MSGPIRIAMWSGPRNISTAMMRSFGARPDCAVMDEPFYAAYLAETGLVHPMRDEVLASQLKMLDHRGEDSGTGDDQMREHYVEHLRHVKFMIGYRRHFDTLFVPYRQVLDRPREETQRINDFLGGIANEAAMIEVVDRALYRNRA